MKTALNLKQLTRQNPAYGEFMATELDAIAGEDHSSDFLAELGGYVHIVEDQDDLDTLLFKERFDSVRYISFHAEDEERYLFWILWVGNNNGGGPTWIVPASLDMSRLSQSFDVYGDLVGIHGDKP